MSDKITPETKELMTALYGAAEMGWRDRIHGSEAVRILKESAKILGIEYEPRKTEIETHPDFYKAF